MALALFLSFSILNIADMTTDGAFVLGSAVSAMMCLSGHPILALPAGMLAAAAAGFITAFLQTKLSVPSILAGIVTNIGLYSINLMVMGKSNQSLFMVPSIYTMASEAGIGGSWHKLIVTAIIVLVVCCSAGAVSGYPAGAVHPGHRRQRGYGAGLLHQSHLYHYSGPLCG